MKLSVDPTGSVWFRAKVKIWEPLDNPDHWGPCYDPPSSIFRDLSPPSPQVTLGYDVYVFITVV